MTGHRRWIALILLALGLGACTIEYPETCPSNTPVGLSEADEIANDDSLPFQFPLEESAIDEKRYYGWFGVSNECTPEFPECYEFPEIKYHAAEDYKRPAGTPVYAMADGIIRYSGTAGGYGWLILIDHPQANLYSLYGHLSPSRWKQKNGIAVERGDLIGYLGDSYENGGSVEEPLDPHLHFGIRGGQVMDYPSKGEWRYNGGWIKLCPQDVGWLQPSLVITSQEIPEGGYPQPKVDFFTRWAFALIYASGFTACGIVMMTQLSGKKPHFLVLLPGLFTIAAGIFLNLKGLIRGALLPIIGILMLGIGVYLIYRRKTQKSKSQPNI